MDIQSIYQQIKDAGLVRSQMQFSQVWLGRSERYYSHLLATKRQPGHATLNHLHVSLAESGSDNQLPGGLRKLADNLRCHIDRRAIVEIRRRRSST